MKISQEKVSLNFKEHLNDGNLWFYAPFFFSGFVASTEDLNFNLIIFKMFLECVGEVLNVNASLCSIGCELFLCGIADSA